VAGIYLLDTNAAIALIGGNPALQALIEPDSHVYISTVTLGELYFGAEKSARVEANWKEVDRIANGLQILQVDVGTAQQYARVRNALRLKGRPIPENDVWISALAIQTHADVTHP
jgi:tRNA(fMet)-specific endonuclease VapC